MVQCETVAFSPELVEVVGHGCDVEGVDQPSLRGETGLGLERGQEVLVSVCKVAEAGACGGVAGVDAVFEDFLVDIPAAGNDE